MKFPRTACLSLRQEIRTSWFARNPFLHAATVATALFAAVGLARAQNYTFHTFSGIATRGGSLDGGGGSLQVPLFNNPFGIAVRADGGLYVTDNGNSIIRAISPAGVVSTFVGTPGIAGGNNGTTDNPYISFNLPQGAVVDGSGNLYVADYAGSTIRKITPTGTVTTLAGTAGSAGSTNATGADARFRNPSSLAIDSAGNLYVADSGNHLIRKITSAGVVTTLAGSTGQAGSTDGTGTAALFSNPRGVAVDSGGNVYVADSSNNLIRKITSAGVVTTLAGSVGAFGGADGQGTEARFSFPNAVAVDGGGNVYVADELNSTIRKITPAGAVTTLAGSAGNVGRVDGTGAVARFERPTGLAVDGSGNIFVADYGNHLIRKVSPGGTVTTLAGAGGIAGLTNGSGFVLLPSLFRNPTGAAIDASGNVYVSDSGNHVIRKVSPSGVTSVLAGGGLGNVNGTGNAARFNGPSGVALDSAGNLYVADTGNHMIRRVTPAGEVTTYAGTASVRGSADGARESATFDFPAGVAVDGGGNVYVADYGNQVIRMISASNGQVSTIAGATGVVGTADGAGSGARFTFPRDIAIDASGNLYVADSGNHAIRKITPGGLVTTLAGNPGSPGSVDGSGNQARFNMPAGLSVDAGGNVFVTDTANNTVRKVTLAGVVTTIGGTAGTIGFADGVGTAALFNRPTDTAVDGAGNVFVVDSRNHTIRVGVLPGNAVPGNPAGSGGGSGSGSGSDGVGGNTDENLGTGQLLAPSAVAASALGGYYVTDTANHVIKYVDSTGATTVYAGTSGSSGTADGTGAAARFNNPTGIIEVNGELYVADTGNSAIRKIASGGVVTTFAGTAGSSGTTDGTGSAARFASPRGITYRSTSTEFFVSDSVNNNIRKITTAGVVTTFAGGTQVSGDADGVGTAARFNNPTGLAITAAAGILLVADTNNNTIRAITTTDTLDSDNVVTTPTGTVTTIAGTRGISGVYDGTGQYALLNMPQGLSIDTSTGFVYIADTGNNAIRRINAANTVVTIAGIAGANGKRNGVAEQALFNQPKGVLVTSSASLIVVDTGNSVLRSVVLPAGTGLYSAAVVNVPLKAGTTTPTPSNPDTGGGGGGGGAPSLWFLAVLGALAGWRFRSAWQGGR